MEKSDLKFGNVVEFRNQKKGILIEPFRQNKMFYLLDSNVNSCVYMELICFNDKLENKDNKYGDIMKVYKDYTCSKLLWERKEPLLTKEEKDYLMAVLKPIEIKITHISIVGYMEDKFLYILFDNNEDLVFPYLTNMTLKFEGLELEKEYTLKELGLEK